MPVEPSSSLRHFIIRMLDTSTYDLDDSLQLRDRLDNIIEMGYSAAPILLEVASDNSQKEAAREHAVLVLQAILGNQAVNGLGEEGADVIISLAKLAWCTNSDEVAKQALNVLARVEDTSQFQFVRPYFQQVEKEHPRRSVRTHAKKCLRYAK